MATTLKSTYESILFGRIRPCSVVLSRFSPVQFFTTPWTVAHQAPVHGVSQARILEWVAISFSRSLFKFMSIESVMPSNHLIFCHPYLLLPSTFPRFRVFSLSQFFPSGGQSIGASASASAFPVNIQGWFPLGLTDLISLLAKGLSKESSLAPQFKSNNSLVLSLLHGTTLYRPLLAKWCLCFLIHCLGLS